MNLDISSAKCRPSYLGVNALPHWGRVTHIWVSKLTIIGSDNGLSPDRRHAIIWTNAGILSIGPLGTNFKEILIEIHIFSFKKMHLNMSSGKWRPFCLGLNALTLPVPCSSCICMLALLHVVCLAQYQSPMPHIDGLVQDCSNGVTAVLHYAIDMAVIILFIKAPVT